MAYESDIRELLMTDSAPMLFNPLCAELLNIGFMLAFYLPSSSVWELVFSRVA
jgi:hypothetical protein